MNIIQGIMCCYKIKIISYLRCAAQLKTSGYLFLADFSWVKQAEEDGFGMHTKCQGDEDLGPANFETFQFFIDNAPGEAFDIFHIPSYLMFRAGYEAAGFDHIEHWPQYPDPKLKNDRVIRKYLDQCKPSDYLMKFKFIKP